MSEGLNPKQDEIAKSQHGIYKTAEAWSAYYTQRMLESGAPADLVAKIRRGAIEELTDYDRLRLNKHEFGDRIGDVGEALENAQRRDATLYRAKEQKDEHLDKYIETARQEAEAAGVDVNLPQAKG